MKCCMLELRHHLIKVATTTLGLDVQVTDTDASEGASDTFQLSDASDYWEVGSPSADLLPTACCVTHMGAPPAALLAAVHSPLLGAAQQCVMDLVADSNAACLVAGAH